MTSPNFSFRESFRGSFRGLATATLSIAVAGLVLMHRADLGIIVHAQSSCGAQINPIVCENQKPGDPSSIWDISGTGDASIQGFATNISVTPGQTQFFKIDTASTTYKLDIYRMGYYAGNGARKIATVTPSASLPQGQPNCLTVAATGLIDCGNWGVSASWPVPADAVSGIYFALLTRLDTGGQSHIVFVVRESDSASHHSDIVFQTSDTTWQAYNQYGGNSFYTGSPANRAYKVSYNRPFTTRGTSPEDWVFNAEYPMVRFLEANGYDVSYITGVDADRSGATILTPSRHKLFTSTGHDEYWSGAQRTHVENARAAGLHLAFFSGNEVFWKTRWEDSIDGSSTPYRTLVCYKETHANAPIDPMDPTVWTGTWRDPRFSPPADGGRPENALTGQLFMVNAGNDTAITVPAADGKMRFWRDTTVATLPAGGVATMPPATLGYEWDADVDNGFRPNGFIQLSSTTRNISGKLLDYGSTFGAGTVTHKLSLYRHASGALVFGAGTVQWSWGLDATHDRGNTPADARMQQATVNLFADMTVQPATLIAGLVQASASLDTLSPASAIATPTAGANVTAGTPVTITGTASENGGGLLVGVEVSTDNGATWFKATGTTSWSYAWTAAGSGSVTIKSRGYDDTGNMETPLAGVTITVGAKTCPCSIWSASTTPPSPLDDGDTASVELGMKFQAETSGYVTGVRFYKASTNTGTHTGSVWTSGGALLGTVTFTGETASGWQQASFSPAIAVTANTTYVVSYHAPVGHYTGTGAFFASTGVDNAPLHALAGTTPGSNGVYAYSSSTTFPANTFNSSNYWVDVVFDTTLAGDTTPPTVIGTAPLAGATSVNPTSPITATFSEAMLSSSIGSSTFELRDPSNALVAASISYNASTNTATLQPTASLATSTMYTATVLGGGADPRVKDAAGNGMTSPVVWSFTTSSGVPTCPCTIWSGSTTPPAPLDSGDPGSVELGLKFKSDSAGYVTGVRFYKASTNTGTHTGTLWTSGGTQLGTVTFTGESASGWQTASFGSAIPVAANTTYVVSYHAPVGHYTSTEPFFTAGVDNAPLHALSSGASGGNGVYAYGSSTTFPTGTFNSSNYWVDVVFTTTAPPAVPVVSIGNATITEGDSGTTVVQVPVTLSASSASTVTVNFATSAQTATAGTDYITTSGVVTFAAGTTSKTIPVTIVGDLLDEVNETFAVTLTSPVNATIGTAQGVVTITDNDPLPIITVTSPSIAEGNSGSKNLTFTATLSRASAKTVSFNYATANGTAVAPTDYTAKTGTVTFAAGVTSQTFTVVIKGDKTVESTETFLVNLSAPTNGTLGATFATGTITNDD